MIRIIGLPRSGTTWMEYLIEKNLDVLVSHWDKHKMVESIEDKNRLDEFTYSVIVRKRLDHWLGSVARTPGIVGRQLYPCLTHDHDTLKINIYSLAVLHDLFMRQWIGWLNANERPYRVVEFKELLADPRQVIQEIANDTGATVAEQFITGPNMHGEETKRSYYLDEGVWGVTPQPLIGRIE